MTYSRLVILGGAAVAAFTGIQGCAAGEARDDLDEVAEEALDAPLRKCPNLTVRRLGVNSSGAQFTVSTTGVPTPNRAAIVSHGSHITCSGASNGDLLVGTTRFSTAYAASKPVVEPRGNVLEIHSPLIAENGVDLIARYTCLLGTLRLEGAGFPSKNVEIYPVFEHSFVNGVFNVLCRVYARGPLSSMRERPAELVRAVGDSFQYRCDLNDTDRRNACSSLCSSQCTANIGFPPDSAGINQCIAQCTNRCASGSNCAPTLCSGSDCPGGCSPENRCTSSSQCGSGRTCSAGCCLTIIR